MQSIKGAAEQFKRLKDRIAEAFPEADDETLLDTADGETNFLDLFDRLILSRAEDAAMVDGLKGYIKQLQERQARIVQRFSTKSTLAQEALESSGSRKIERSAYTASLRTVAAKIVVTDETAIPAELCSYTRAIDKAALKDAMKAGAVAGAEWGNGGQTLAIRIR